VCTWKRWQLGKLAAYIFPQLDAMELYRVAGQSCVFAAVAVGIALTVFLSYLNYPRDSGQCGVSELGYFRGASGVLPPGPY